MDPKIKSKILSNWIRQKYAPKPDYRALFIAISVFIVILNMGLFFYVLLLTKDEFKHLIINLINNSKDAFNENNIKERKILIKATTTQNHTSLTIKDNAGGIPKHAIKHIFEPNFTTKEVGKGTGIGLYMSTQILEKMGAKIKVKNIDNGACFFIDKL